MWSTSDEIRFVKGIGTHSKPGERASKKRLLIKYLNGCASRVNWGTMDKEAVVSFARTELSRCRSE